MLAFQAFHLAAYHFAHGTFQPTATGSVYGCSDLDGLLGDGPDPVDLNAALDVCFDPQFSCSHAEVQRRRLPSPSVPHPHPNPLTLTLTPQRTLTLALALILTLTLTSHSLAEGPDTNRTL